MSDRELLELAAKAAGLDLTVVGDSLYFTRGGYLMRRWNPLADEGDALRLMVALHLSLIRYALHVMVVDPNRVAVSENYMADPAVATRRAIVRAAAEIGKGMK